MALSKAEEIRELSDEEIATEILAEKKRLFELRLESAKGTLEKPHLFKHAKHRLSQLLTIERERQLEINTSEEESAPASSTDAQPENAANSQEEE